MSVLSEIDSKKKKFQPLLDDLKKNPDILKLLNNNDIEFSDNPISVFDLDKQTFAQSNIKKYYSSSDDSDSESDYDEEPGPENNFWESGQLRVSFRRRFFEEPTLHISITTYDGKSFESICIKQYPFKILCHAEKFFNDESAVAKIAAYILRIHETLMMPKDDVFNVFKQIDEPTASFYRNIGGLSILLCSNEDFCGKHLFGNRSMPNSPDKKSKIINCIEKLRGNFI
jgi:hypothetical protein